MYLFRNKKKLCNFVTFVVISFLITICIKVSFDFEDSIMPLPSLIDTNFMLNNVRQPDMERSEVLSKFTIVFYSHFLPMNMEWFSSFERQSQTLTITEGTYFIVRSSVSDSGEEVFAFGAGLTESVASDTSCLILSEKLLVLRPNFMMPKFAIGYPNFRGFCYLISAILPLVHSFPFIERLFKEHLIFSSKYLTGLFVYNSECRFEEEVPYFWTDLIYRVYNVYQDISSDGDVSNDLKYVYPGVMDEDGNDGSKNYPGNIRVMSISEILDDTLYNDLNACLVQYCSAKFKLPGGDERLAYYYIMTKLASEISGFRDDFFIQFISKYTCCACSGMGEKFSNVFSTPILRIPPDISFQSFLNDPVQCFIKQRFRSIHDVDNVICGCRIRDVETCCFSNVPKILVFAVNFRENSSLSVDVPDYVNLTVSNQIFTYAHLSSSICFHCYKGKNGQDYGDFYHPYQDGDEIVDEHTIIHLRTQQGFIEINNGDLYNCDNRIFKKVTPGSLHMYQLDKYSSYAPDVKNDDLKENPML